MGQIEVFSPAKINLFLSVLGRMENGFHELASLVAQVDFGDRLFIDWEAADSAAVELSCDDPSLPTDSGNLAYAAAEGFLLRSGLKWRVRIRLEKRIPHGAGLGGGSSNASAVLTALGKLAQEAGELGLSRGETLELAAELGSDCPLFLDQKPKLMRGRGEVLSPVFGAAAEDLVGRELLLFKPSFSISTPWAYKTLAATEGAYDQREWAEERLAAWSSGDLDLSQLLHNSFEKVAFPKYAAFDPLFRKMKGYSLECLMSGSGSSCFALLSSSSNVALLEGVVRDCWGDRVFVKRAKVLG
ncbi:4-(cytidine 5'-diphospho)-2-C-methyl-D-erythritol kinase [Pelagicoccus albus]|uniref:4-diphosphocytidyl-2-C-methyl-D-erythritol kinase n=1 Tax=Pelagicoccus albus TaxID=415222 RepID=A0A7X1E6W6_9BACT|nr:4-(cytidine 5'-diphospho)-2-C-methyl-D-erythritol kinase [Pelagicoccus albus]MBC2604518.1 4-(cytidine 5'-diphospho)-2-C-methyl-D-erythritol kinase [Pelagicoccus albus]